MAPAPSVYIFYGDDRAAMYSAVANLQSKLGDPTTAEMNTTRLEGAPSLDALSNAAMAMPFLSERRLVVAEGAIKAFSAAEARARFTSFLDGLPATTALVLLEEGQIKDNHWLLKWADGAEGRAFVMQYFLPKGPQMAAWLQSRAKELGGELQPQAAAQMASLLGSDKNAAEQELEKLLAYVAYRRPIEAADVEALSLPIGEQGDFFGLLDALTGGNRSGAMQLLETLLQERDGIMLFFSLVSHFRLLIQARELVDQGKKEDEIAKILGIHPYRAKKMAAQARRFSDAALAAIYQHLLQLDQQVKTGEIESALAMETFVAGLSLQAG